MGYVSKLQHEVIKHFAPILKSQNFRKGERIHREGEICQSLYLVESGVIRAFYLKDIKEITAHFAFNGEAITAPDSFINNTPSKYYLDALEDSQVYAVNRTELDSYLDAHPHLEKLARQFTQAIYLELLERIESLMFLTAIERYEVLFNRNPNLVRNVSLGHIASYLGITQETLSRIRAKVGR